MKEIWKDIVGYEGLYQVSNLGRVKSLARVDKNKNGRPLPIKERILSPRDNGVGYYGVSLCRSSIQKRCLIHRLVAQHFIENQGDKPMVNHKDGDPSNNTVSNLEWVTMRENVCHGLKKSGSRKKSSKFPGVHLNPRNIKRKWKSVVFVGGIHKYIGSFSTEEEAHKAYQGALTANSISNKYAKV